MDARPPTNWDLIVKVVGLIALIASGMWTLYKFRDDRRVDLEHRKEADKKDDDARAQEFNKYVFERQTDLYFEAARTAATISTSNDKQAVKKAIDRFHSLYFGDLVIVEDRRVERAMIAFNRCLDSNNTLCVRPPGEPKTPTSDPGAFGLNDFSLELAACIRSALTGDRGIDFGKLSHPQTFCPYIEAQSGP